MSKAILVMDMPKSCKDCRIRFSDSYSHYCPYVKQGTYYEDVYHYVQDENKPDYCPLKEVPEKKELYLSINDERGYCEGYNACIDEILGGSEEND